MQRWHSSVRAREASRKLPRFMLLGVGTRVVRRRRAAGIGRVSLSSASTSLTSTRQVRIWWDGPPTLERGWLRLSDAIVFRMQAETDGVALWEACAVQAEFDLAVLELAMQFPGFRLFIHRDGVCVRVRGIGVIIRRRPGAGRWVRQDCIFARVPEEHGSGLVRCCFNQVVPQIVYPGLGGVPIESLAVGVSREAIHDGETDGAGGIAL